MKTKHTKGEWTICYSRRDGLPGIDAISDEGNFSVIVLGERDELYGIQGRSREEIEANAKLIAAAPYLLDALILVQQYLKMISTRKDNHNLPFIEQVINKATL